MEIGIIGYGRFGQFAAERLRKDFQVVVYDRKRVRCPRGIRAGSLEEVASRPLLLLCVPISQISKTCLEIKPYLTPGQLIIDTCSVKEKPASRNRLACCPGLSKFWELTLCSDPTVPGTEFAA